MTHLTIKKKKNLFKLRNEYRWQTKYANGRTMGASTEGYFNPDDIRDNLYALRDLLNRELPANKAYFRIMDFIQK